MSAEEAEEALRCIADIQRRGFKAHIKRCGECRDAQQEEGRQLSLFFDGYSIVERLAREFKENMPEGVSFNFNSEDAMVQVNQAADELRDPPYE